MRPLPACLAVAATLLLTAGACDMPFGTAEVEARFDRQVLAPLAEAGLEPADLTRTVFTGCDQAGTPDIGSWTLRAEFTVDSDPTRVADVLGSAFGAEPANGGTVRLYSLDDRDVGWAAWIGPEGSGSEVTFAAPVSLDGGEPSDVWTRSCDPAPGL